MKNIYMLIGKSGSGKSTIADMLEKELGYRVVQSYTTRPPRYEGETGHTFVTKEEFDKFKMVAYTKFDKYEYGVPAEMIDESDIYVIDIAGLNMVKELYNNKKIVSIYFDIPEDIMRERMLNRGDSEEKIKARIENDAVMFKDADSINFDYRIAANVSLNMVFEQIKQIIGQEEAR